MEIIGYDLLLWAIGDVLGQHGLGLQRGFVLGAYVAPFDIVNYICIDAGPVNCLSGLGLHFFHPLVYATEASKGMVEEFGGTQT